MRILTHSYCHKDYSLCNNTEQKIWCMWLMFSKCLLLLLVAMFIFTRTSQLELVHYDFNVGGKLES